MQAPYWKMQSSDLFAPLWPPRREPWDDMRRSRRPRRFAGANGKGRAGRPYSSRAGVRVCRIQIEQLPSTQLSPGTVAPSASLPAVLDPMLVRGTLGALFNAEFHVPTASFPYALAAVFLIGSSMGCSQFGPDTHRPAPNDLAGGAPQGETDAPRLHPAIQVAGRSPVAWTLADRMAHHKVPGVSIAVIEQGRILWARGFGKQQAGEAVAVTEKTLFQAASVSKVVAATIALRLADRDALDLDADVNHSTLR